MQDAHGVKKMTEVKLDLMKGLAIYDCVYNMGRRFKADRFWHMCIQWNVECSWFDPG